MAWLQNITGQAEKFLEKIDQKAADVLLNESNFKPNTNIQEHSISIADIDNVAEIGVSNGHSSFEQPPLALEYEETSNGDTNDNAKQLKESPTQEFLVIEPNSFLDDGKKTPSLSSKSESVLQSFSSAEDIQQYLERISKLEFENDDLSKQLLNMQHLYLEIRNENSILKNDLERANESVNAAEMEMEKYKARAYRILQEKEKIICLQPNENNSETIDSLYKSYNEELKNELKFQKDKNDEMKEKIGSLTSELKSLQQQYVVMQNMFQQSNQKLELELHNERKISKSVEEELKSKSQELNNLQQELARRNNESLAKNDELEQLKSHLKQYTIAVNHEELEERIKNLTQTLMIKQNKIEAITSERNALRIQLEKLENEYHRNLVLARSIQQQKTVFVNDTDDVKLQVPNTVRVSPLDAGVTRRVKHAYSSLDALSIRTGVFLRRYPRIRVFVFCYMIFLQLWVFVILFNYAPSTRGDCL